MKFLPIFLQVKPKGQVATADTYSHIFVNFMHTL